MASYDKRASGWSVRFWYQGKQVRLSGYPRKSDAEKAYREYLINENVESPVTFQEMAYKYLTSHKNDVKESTIVSIESVLKTQVFPIIGCKPIDRIKATDFDLLKEHINGYSQNYRSKVWSHTGAVLHYAQSRFGCQTINQFKALDTIARDTTKKEYWSVNEFRTFINAVKNEYTATKDYTHYRYYILFNFLYFIGTRKGEMMALQWQDIDLDNATILIDKTLTTKLTHESREKGFSYKVTDTKTHKERLVDIPDQLRELLLDFKAKENPLPTDNVFFKEHPIPAETLRRVFDHYIEIAGVKRITPHQFRHSNASLLISNGTNNELATIYVIAERLGHSPKMTMEVYGNLFESAKKTLVSKLKI